MIIVHIVELQIWKITKNLDLFSGFFYYRKIYMKLKIYADEAWRWPLAGPVVVWLTLPLEKVEEYIFDDSKKLTEKKREIIFKKLKIFEQENKILHSFWYANNKEVDKLWISKCINIAFKRALVILLHKYISNYKSINGDKLLAKIKLENKLNNILSDIENIEKYDIKEVLKLFQKVEKVYWIIFDGNQDFNISKDIWYKIINIIKWDARVSYIWAASIIAKVERDMYMVRQWELHPNYLFEKHKWYGTKKHIESIKKYWICNLHRESFLKNII